MLPIKELERLAAGNLNDVEVKKLANGGIAEIGVVKITICQRLDPKKFEKGDVLAGFVSEGTYFLSNATKSAAGNLVLVADPVEVPMGTPSADSEIKIVHDGVIVTSVFGRNLVEEFVPLE